MAALNYHQLRYFWTVARLGSVASAAAELERTPPTVSSQIKELEHALGVTLLERSGRGLMLTEEGELVRRYADEIFTLGGELEQLLGHRTPGGERRLAVGAADVLPKLIVHRLLEPVLGDGTPPHVLCTEGKLERLREELTAFRLDVVLSDEPGACVSGSVHTQDHLLGESGVTLFAATDQADALRARFPRSLEGSSMLLPAVSTQQRKLVDEWLEREGLHPHVVGEFEDSALMGAFGAKGRGVFPAPSVIADDIERQYGVERIGCCEGARERFYAITAERKLTHPAVIALTEAARKRLFA